MGPDECASNDNCKCKRPKRAICIEQLPSRGSKLYANLILNKCILYCSLLRNPTIDRKL